MRDKIINNSKMENIIVFFFSIFLSAILGLNSPLHPWIGGETLTDSSVFKTVVLMMERGYLPYKDSFDHKGPVLYLLNWLGNRISQYRGMWVIEIVVIGITIFVMYKIARLSCGVLPSVITTLTAFSLLFVYFEGGNFTEEYAMPCIAIGIYYFLEYLKNGKLSNVQIINSGVCCGIVLLLRPNMVTVWFVYCLYITILLISQKKYKEWGSFVLFFTLGVLILTLPFVIWLIVNNDFDYFVNSYIIFNIKYSSAEGGRALFSSKWSSFFYFFNTTVCFLAFFSILLHLKGKDRMLNLVYLVYMILTISFMVMSGMPYGHYGMVMIPAMVYPIGLVFNDIEKIREPEVSKTITIITSLYLLCIVITPNWVDTINRIVSCYETKEDYHIGEITSEVVKRINKYTKENETISVYGNWDAVYVLSDRAHATRYSYQFPIGSVMPEIMDEYFIGLQEELPKVIVVQQGYYDVRIQEFLTRNEYKMNYSSSDQANKGSTLLFRRQSVPKDYK